LGVQTLIALLGLTNRAQTRGIGRGGESQWGALRCSLGLQGSCPQL